MTASEGKGEGAKIQNEEVCLVETQAGNTKNHLRHRVAVIMLSKDLAQGFSPWTDLADEALGDVSQDPGVYVLRLKGGTPFGRLRGVSDIVYVGKTDKGLRNRIRQYLHPGPTQWTNIRVNEFMRRYRLEFACAKDGNPKAREHELLRSYLRDHDELPPLNHKDEKTVAEWTSDTITIRDDVVAWVERGKQ